MSVIYLLSMCILCFYLQLLMTDVPIASLLSLFFDIEKKMFKTTEN